MPQVIGQIALNLAISKGTEYFSRPGLREKWAWEEANRPRVDVDYAGGVEARRCLLGYFRAAGLNVIPPMTTGAAGETLHKMIALSDGEIDGIDGYVLNNTRIDAADVSGSGILSGTDFDGFATITYRLGEASQTAYAHAVGPLPGWTADHRGDGVASVYFTFYVSREKWTGGAAPQTLVEGRGVKVYDPRLDISPGANPTSDTYKAFTTNAALNLAHFLTWESGANELPANINWADVVTAANICDEDVDIPAFPSGTTTQKRYTCSVEVFSPLQSQERDETIRMLARAMMGYCWSSGGQWRMRAGAYTSPVSTTIGDDDFLRDFRVRTSKPRSEAGVFNTVRGTYTDQIENTQPKGYPEVSTSSYVTEDGEVIHGNREWPTARTVYEAERNAILSLRLSRRRVQVSANFRPKAGNIELYDVVTVTCSKIGWSSQDARCIYHKQRPDFTVDMVLEECGSADYTDPDPADYLTPDNVPAPVSASYQPFAPQNLRYTPQASAIIFEWDPPTNAPVGVLYRLYEHSSSTPFSSATQVGPDTAQTSIIIPRSNTTVAYFWVTAVDPATLAESTQAPPTNGMPASAATASSALGALVNPGSATATVFTSSATTNSVTVTATGGTAPYTYAWTFTVGGTNIQADSPTAATTTFSNSTALAEGDSRTGTARCRVTDNVGATFDVYVAVTIERQYGVTLNNATYTGNGGASMGPAATAGIVISSDGNVYPSASGSLPASYQWKDPSADSADYEVRIVENSFSGAALSSNTASSFTRLSSGVTAQAIGVRPPGGAGTNSQDLTITIRLYPGGATVATANVNLIETTV